MITDERLSHLASVIVDGIWKEDLVDFTDDDLAMRLAKRAAAKFAEEMKDVDRKAKATVASLKRNVVEGSPEWDVLYKKYYEEEMQRRGN
ncbi:MAG: DUF507 family protein [Bdellovibrionaceae bacterium]|nr:DUF507 family protein [Pseudobdellovibrionaceae bacterium]